MANEHVKLRGVVLTEDRRTERFFRELLDSLGFDKRKFIFLTAPSGRGNACAWVRSQYAHEVNLLRRKRHQRLCLIAVRDGDNVGVTVRKTEMDDALVEVGLAPRGKEELIVLPVPTWSIETWLLGLLAREPNDETISRKREFEALYSESSERDALRNASRDWSTRADQVLTIPSLADGKQEMKRIHR